MIAVDTYGLEIELYCEECDHVWAEEMSQLATGYDICFGLDYPAFCPRCKEPK